MAKRSAAMLSRERGPAFYPSMPAPSAWVCHPTGFPSAWSYVVFSPGICRLSRVPPAGIHPFGCPPSRRPTQALTALDPLEPTQSGEYAEDYPALNHPAADHASGAQRTERAGPRQRRL